MTCDKAEGSTYEISSATALQIPVLQALTILPAQLRAARGLLDWGREDCARATGLSPETIKNIEYGTFRPNNVTCGTLMRAFAERGVELLNLMHMQLHTVSGVEIKGRFQVTGAVFLVPHSMQSDAEAAQ